MHAGVQRCRNAVSADRYVWRAAAERGGCRDREYDPRCAARRCMRTAVEQPQWYEEVMREEEWHPERTETVQRPAYAERERYDQTKTSAYTTRVLFKMPAKRVYGASSAKRKRKAEQTLVMVPRGKSTSARHGARSVTQASMRGVCAQRSNRSMRSARALFADALKIIGIVCQKPRIPQSAVERSPGKRNPTGARKSRAPYNAEPATNRRTEIASHTAMASKRRKCNRSEQVRKRNAVGRRAWYARGIVSAERPVQCRWRVGGGENATRCLRGAVTAQWSSKNAVA